MGVDVTGPDGKQYQFPDGTTKDVAVAYFKKKGIGVPRTLGEQYSAKKAAGELPKGTAYTFRNPKEFLQQDVGRLQEVAQEEQRKATPAMFRQGKYVGDRPVLSQAGHGVLSGVAETGAVVEKLVSGLMDWKSALALGAGLISPVIPAAYFSTQGITGGVEAGKDIHEHGLTPENVQDLAISGATVAGSAAGAGEHGAGLSEVGRLRKIAAEKMRTGVQDMAGAGPTRTTEPMIEEFKTKTGEAREKQLAETKATDEANRQKIEDYQTAKREALRKGQEQTAEHTLSKEEVAEANRQEQARVDEINRAAAEQQGKRSELAQNIKAGSQKLGEGIKEQAAKVKAQDDANYAALREKLGNDPGVPLSDLSHEARKAEGMIKGSTENIKQFRELIRKAPETEGVQTSAGFVQPGDPLYDQLVREGAIDTGGSLPFDQLQGYSSEIGIKLSKGGLPGDVYQALKYLKGKIDAAKVTIAERNGAGADLKAADSFHYNYMDTFYDKPSAVAASLERVGKLDPEFYAEPFITGKAGQTGIGKLQRYNPELADLATSLRKQHAEFSGLPKTAKTVTPELKGEPADLAPVEPPRKPELKAPKKIETPSRPTVEDVKARKTKEIKSAAREIGRLNRWDASLIVASAIGPFFGHLETLLIDPAYLLGRKAMGRVLDKPAVTRWLSNPSAEDLRILNSLPKEVSASVANDLADYVVQQKTPVRLAPQTKAFLGPTNVARIVAASGAASGGQIVRNRKEALDRLGQPTQ